MPRILKSVRGLGAELLGFSPNGKPIVVLPEEYQPNVLESIKIGFTEDGRLIVQYGNISEEARNFSLNTGSVSKASTLTKMSTSTPENTALGSPSVTQEHRALAFGRTSLDTAHSS
jgi:hypothetical protein